MHKFLFVQTEPQITLMRIPISGQIRQVQNIAKAAHSAQRVQRVDRFERPAQPPHPDIDRAFIDCRFLFAQRLDQLAARKDTARVINQKAQQAKLGISESARPCQRA